MSDSIFASGESSPAFPGLVRVRVFWPFMKRLASSPTSRVRNWERKDSHLIRSSIKPEKTTNLFLAKIFFNLKNKSLKDSSPWLKIRIFSLFLTNRPKDSNLRTRVRIFDSPLIFGKRFPLPKLQINSNLT
jgi:hypothetical protein